MDNLAVISIPGFSRSMLGANTPHLNRLIDDGFATVLDNILPAVTCSVQTSILTGVTPARHGIVANGWFFRDLNEVWLWRQSEGLVEAETVYQAAKKLDFGFTCLKHFWWYNMATSADIHVTPRPVYHADGRKEPDIYARPTGISEELQREFGAFPLFKFWGPGASLPATEWIAKTGLYLIEKYNPTLSLIYLPHLDYDQQRYGPDDSRIPGEVMALDKILGSLITPLREKGREVLILSEYDIQAASKPVHLNRILRQCGWLEVICNATGELLDFGGSAAFAVADHQIAHIYIKDPALIADVKKKLEQSEGIDKVFDDSGKKEAGLDHPRSGELVALAADQYWFTYYYWLDDNLAPDFARCVDIHRKPGYDPVELLVNPDMKFPRLAIAAKVLQKKLGMRYLMNVIGLDADLVKGSHGRPPVSDEAAPVIISSAKSGERNRFHVCDLKQFMLDRIFKS
ncbi:alkaline phosphatase family protein [Planctomycetota bacterium]